MKSNIKELDELIRIPFKGDSKKYLKKISDLIQDIEQIEPKETYSNFLFRVDNAKSTKKFISYCFLRIWASKNKNHLDDIRHDLLKQILDSLQDICEFIGISEKTETYKKEQTLTEFIQERETEFATNLVFDGEFIDITTFQQTYRRTCNNTKNEILHQFTGDILQRSNLDKIFGRLNIYIKAIGENKYGAYTDIESSINQLIEDAESYSTIYAVNYIVNPFNRLLDILKNDIEKSPFFQPAILEVFKTEKKYPLHKGVKSFFNIGIKNTGTGYAQNVIINIENFNNDDIIIHNKQKHIGKIKLEDTIIEFDYEVINTIEKISLGVNILWNGSNNASKKSTILVLNAQQNDIDWEKIKSYEPYNLEPVETEPELIGRNNVLQRLRNMMTLPLGSSYIFGQRRVGKTSIVKTFLNSNAIENLLIIYIEAGDWNDANDPKNSMNNLGEKICKKIKRYSPKFSSINVPNFQGSFNKISDFLEEVEYIDNSFKCIIILDEFDRISRKLYERGDIGQSFTLTLRSISNRPQFGFILVGGEKLEYILSQWQEFNKFKSIRVDYFNKENDFEDFKKLIKHPVNDILEISDSAISSIYEETTGNPYFTKKICMELFILMVSHRDIHVTKREAISASLIARSSTNIGATDFSHFWEDGIKGKIEKEEETSLNRRKLLIAITNILLSNQKLIKDNIIDKGIEMGLKPSDVEKYLLEFERRKILYKQSDEYNFVVKFFKEWLMSSGIEKIVATFEEEERVQINLQLEEKAKIKNEEIIELLKNISIYKGKKIEINNVRNWLGQFDDVFDQRLIFKILQNFKLYDENELRQKFESILSFVRNEIKKAGKVVVASQKSKGNVRLADSRKKKRDDIIVTNFDINPAKGGSYMLKIFVDQNNILQSNACNANLLEKTIKDKQNINCLLVLDDFIGSGNTFLQNIEEYFTEELCTLIKDKDLIVIIAAITGYLSAKELIIDKLKEKNIQANVIIADILNDTDKCFSDSSMIFTTPSEKKKAELLCSQKGELLVPKFPLGYSDCQSLIAFPMNCPNNTLPIFWKKTSNWEPLFERN